jgi:kumamolisin
VLRAWNIYTSVLLLVCVMGAAQPQEVQVPPTDLSKETEKPGTMAHSTYLVSGPNGQRAQKYPKAHPVPPDTDFATNVLNPFENELSSLPPEKIVLSQIRVFTNYLVLEGEGVTPSASGAPRGETPETIREAYNVVPNGGSGTIAIVDPFNYPTAIADLQVFSETFEIPCDDCLQVKYASGDKPADNCSWAREAAIDIQWAHAMAPQANLLLVEAKTSSLPDMIAAVDYAANAVSQSGGGQVSMSWGGKEFVTENSLDKHFVKPGVVFVAASGDVGGLATYPSESPNVVAVGGTTILRNDAGKFVEEDGWGLPEVGKEGSGGGPSAFEVKPHFQTGVNKGSTKRSAPDVSADADPFSGVAVFDSTTCQGRNGWLVAGGTSLSAPLVAGMINSAKSSASSSYQELTRIYSHSGDGAKFRDIIKGAAGSYSAGVGYDFVTGLGSPLDSNFDKP